MQERITLSSIAAACNVRPATVSRVLNNVSKGFSVSPDKRKLIEKMAKDMGYVPNIAAQNLRLNRTNRIMVYGLTIGWGIKETTYSYMMLSCVKTLNAAGFEVDVVYPASNHQILSRMAFDGAIIINPDSKLIMDNIDKLKIPYVVMNDRPDIKNCSYVAVNDFGGMDLAISHLWLKGHRNIAYRCGPHSAHSAFTHKSISERYQAYLKILSEKGAQAFSDYESALNDAEFNKELKRRKITAVITYNVTNALALLKQCAVDKIKIPDKLSVITFNEPVYDTFPVLSAITLPLNKMGKAVADILIAKISGSNEVKQLIFEECLLEGESVANLNL